MAALPYSHASRSDVTLVVRQVQKFVESLPPEELAQLLGGLHSLAERLRPQPIARTGFVGPRRSASRACRTMHGMRRVQGVPVADIRNEQTQATDDISDLGYAVATRTLAKGTTATRPRPHFRDAPRAVPYATSRLERSRSMRSCSFAAELVSSTVSSTDGRNSIVPRCYRSASAREC